MMISAPKKKIKSFYWLLMLTMLVVGCKHAEKVVAPKKIKRYNVGRVIKQVNDNALRYESLSVKKYVLSFTNQGKETSFRGSYKIRHDSLIQIYAQKMSIPIGKLEIKADSFQLVDYIDQEVLVGKNNVMERFVGLDLEYPVLQALLTNQLFSFRQDPKEKNFKDYVCDIEDNMYKISSMRERKLKRFNKKEERLERYRNRVDESHLIKQDIYIDPDSFVVRRMIFQDLEMGRRVNMEFSNYERVMNQWFPSHLNVKMEGEKEMELSIEMSKISLDDEKSFGFTVPPKYKRKTVE